MTVRLAVIAATLCLASAQTHAQGPAQAPGRALALGALQRAAAAADPRAAQPMLLEAQRDLRLRNLSASWLPVATVEGVAQYQTDVPASPILSPAGQPIFSQPKDQYDLRIRFDQRLFDPAIAAQSALERASATEQQARVQTALFGLRQEVNEAFFTAAALEQRAAAVAASIDNLEGRLREVQARVGQGTVLPSDAAAVEAALLQLQQEAGELGAGRRAALARLARLTRQPVADADTLVLPDLAAAVALARQATDSARQRPEYAQFQATREKVERQRDVATAQDRPRVSAFGRIGYGKPGLNFIEDRFDLYGLGGVQLQWRTWDWGSTKRERDALTLQQQLVSADEDAFARGLARGVESDVAAFDRLLTALALDDRIIALRQQIDSSTRVRFDEGVVTAAEYLDRNAELLQARVARAGHQVELAQAGARLLTTLGMEVR